MVLGQPSTKNYNLFLNAGGGGRVFLYTYREIFKNKYCELWYISLYI